jgi:hypothetical protein
MSGTTIETGKTGKMKRRALVRELLRDRGGLLAIGGLGAPAWDITAAGDARRTCRSGAAWAAPSMMGLGLALAQPSRRVLVITGDGEMLMGIGSLATSPCRSRRTSRSWCRTTSTTARPGCRRRTPATAWTSPAWRARPASRTRGSSPTRPMCRRCGKRSTPAKGPLFAQVKIDEAPGAAGAAPARGRHPPGPDARSHPRPRRAPA